MSVKTYSYQVLIHPDRESGGFWVEVPALPGCFTQGETVEECFERAREAISTHVEGLVKVGEPIPEEPQRESALISTLRVNIALPA